MNGAGFRTATMDETPECYGVCEVGFGHIRKVVETFAGDPASATQAIDRANELREQDIANREAGLRTLQALALIHLDMVEGLRERARVAFRPYPQYDGKYDGPEWVAVRFTRNMETKGGVRFLKGDIALGRPTAIDGEESGLGDLSGHFDCVSHRNTNRDLGGTASNVLVPAEFFEVLAEAGR